MATLQDIWEVFCAFSRISSTERTSARILAFRLFSTTYNSQILQALYFQIDTTMPGVCPPDLPVPPTLARQPRISSRSTFSARARSRAYSSSEIVPACRRSSSRKRLSFSASRLVPTAASTSFSIAAPFVGAIAAASLTEAGASGAGGAACTGADCCRAAFFVFFGADIPASA